MMNIPTREECLKMLRDEGTPDNIIEHTLQVTRVAVFIANRLREKGIGVDARLVESGALLHDVKKWDEIVNKRHASHGEAGMLLLKERYPEVASLVKKHMLYEILDGGLTTWEEKIINYADKRANNCLSNPLFC